MDIYKILKDLKEGHQTLTDEIVQQIGDEYVRVGNQILGENQLTALPEALRVHIHNYDLEPDDPNWLELPNLLDDPRISKLNAATLAVGMSLLQALAEKTDQHVVVVALANSLSIEDAREFMSQTFEAEDYEPQELNDGAVLMQDGKVFVFEDGELVELPEGEILNDLNTGEQLMVENGKLVPVVEDQDLN